MEKRTVKATIKKRSIQKNPNDSFKGKLRGNIGKLRCLNAPQLLVKFGVGDIVPSSLVKSLIATSANKKGADRDKNIITSTPHYTKVKGNAFFNTSGSSVFSPINFKENEEEEKRKQTVSEDSEILSPRHAHQRNSSVIYVCTKDGGGNNLSNSPKKKQNVNASTNNPLKPINTGEPPPDPPITKKSKIPIRTASQERENVLPAETRDKSNTSQKRPASKVRRSNSVPAKTPEQQRQNLSSPLIERSASNLTIRRGTRRRNHSKGDSFSADTVQDKVTNQKNEFANNIGLFPVDGNTSERTLRSKQNKSKDAVNSPKKAKSTASPSLNLSSFEEIKTRKKTLEESKSRGTVNTVNQTSTSSFAKATTSPTKEAPPVEGINTRRKTLEGSKSRGIVNKDVQTSFATPSNASQQNKKKNANNNEQEKSEKKSQKKDTSLSPNLIEEIKLRKAALEVRKPMGIVSKAIQTSAALKETTNINEATINDTAVNETEKGSDLSSLIEELKSRNTDLQTKRKARNTISGAAPVKKGPQSVNRKETNITLGHVLSHQGMAEKKKNWDEFCARLESFVRLRAGSSTEGDNDTASGTPKNRRFNVESPKNVTNKSGRRGAVFSFIASAKKRQSPTLKVSVSSVEKRESLHNWVEKIKSTNTKAKKGRETVNKEIQTSVLGQSVCGSRAPVFRRSAVRKGLGLRSSGTMLEYDDSTSSSSNTHTSQGPNIFDSLKEGNPLDALYFSDFDGPNSSQIEKPWRFEDDDNSAQSDLYLNFIRPESLMTLNSAKIASRRMSSSSSDEDDESDVSLNNKTLTQNDVSRRSASRVRFRPSRPDLKRYRKKSKGAVRQVLQFPCTRMSPDKVHSTTSSSAAIEHMDASREAAQNIQKAGVLRNYARQSKKFSNQAETSIVSPPASEGERIEALPEPTNLESSVADAGPSGALPTTAPAEDGEKDPALESNNSIPNALAEAPQVDDDVPSRPSPPPTATSNSKKQSNRKRRGAHKENELPEQAPEAKKKAAKPRHTKSSLSDMNILASEDGRRPQRNRKPVKYHTDIDIEALGYILVSARGTKKKPATTKKGATSTAAKKTKKSQKNTNPELVSDGGGQDAEDLQQETNRSNPDNVVVDVLEPITDNLQVAETEIVPLPTTSAKRRGRKRLVADSRYETSIPKESNKKSRANTSAGHLNSSVFEHATAELQPIDDPQIMENNIMPPPRVSTIGRPRGRRVRKKLAVDSGYENSDSEENSKRGRPTSSRKTGGSALGRELRSSVQPTSISHEHRLDEQNGSHDLMDTCSGLLDRASTFSSALRPTGAGLETNNDTDFNDIRRISSSHRIYDDFVTSINDGQVSNLRYMSRVPPESSFRQLGNLYISETIADPKGNFSAGFLRLDLGDQKKPNVGYKYSFIFTVLSGTAHVNLEDKQSIANQGEFFYVPRGMKYSIKNSNSQRNLLLSYTRIRGQDADR